MDAADMFAPAEDLPDPIPAATLVIFRTAQGGGPPQLLMVERSATMRFAGGAAVFPGGRVDQADCDLAAALGATDADAGAEWAARIAAVRETIEETGLVVGVREPVDAADAARARALLAEHGALAPVLAAMGWTLDLDALVPFARWCPRHRHLRIFDTRFYLADLGTGAVEVDVDASENTHLFWASADEVLALAASGQIRIIFPTRRNLERLAQFGTFAEALAHVVRFPSRMITPFVEQRGGAAWLAIPPDAGYPVTGEPIAQVERS